MSEQRESNVPLDQAASHSGPQTGTSGNINAQRIIAPNSQQPSPSPLLATGSVPPGSSLK
ncbi:hypothetical protein AB6A40_011845, partial [Gnathostoma spinigerum]